MEEIWKDVSVDKRVRRFGTHQLAVSSLGRVRENEFEDFRYEVHEARIVEPDVDKYGFQYVRIQQSCGTFMQYNVHGLVAIEFIPNPNKYKFIRHKDGDRSNNRADNLEWVEYGGTLASRDYWELQMLALSGVAPAIRQYSSSGEFVAEYKSYMDVLGRFGIRASLVDSYCSRKPSCQLCFDNVWRFVNDDELYELEPVERMITAGFIPIRRYTTDGHVREYTTLDAAAKSCSGQKQAIRSCCRRKAVTYLGYVWRYADDDEFINGASLSEYIKRNR